MNQEEINPISKDILNEINLDNIPQPQLTGHMWRQEGTQLICQSCTFTHATFIPVGYQLYGIDEEGKPQIRKYLNI